MITREEFRDQVMGCFRPGQIAMIYALIEYH
jgi:hypothetical protein